MRMGRLSIGSETFGERSQHCGRAILQRWIPRTERASKAARGRGGVVEDIRFDNWTMENVGEAIVVTNYYLMEGETRMGLEPVSKTTPIFRNIAMSHMTIDGAKRLIDIDGLPEMPIENLRISDVMGTGKTGMTATYTDGLEIHDVQTESRGWAGVYRKAFEQSRTRRCDGETAVSRLLR